MAPVSQNGSPGEMSAQAAMPAAVMAPFTSSTLRMPKRLTIGLVAAFMRKLASM